MKALLVEDDDRIAAPAMRAMGEAGFSVRRVPTAAEATAVGLSDQSDVIVLDLGLPDADGLDVLRHWRAEGLRTPVLILTARGGWMERVEGLNAGADDYLPKPFQPEELIARMNALLRRTAPAHASSPAEPRLGIDFSRRAVTIHGRAIHLTPREFQLASILAESPGDLISAADLVARLALSDVRVTENAVEVLIGRLRRKLGDGVIGTRRGFGYFLAEE